MLAHILLWYLASCYLHFVFLSDCTILKKYHMILDDVSGNPDYWAIIIIEKKIYGLVF